MVDKEISPFIIKQYYVPPQLRSYFIHLVNIYAHPKNTGPNLDGQNVVSLGFFVDFYYAYCFFGLGVQNKGSIAVYI